MAPADAPRLAQLEDVRLPLAGYIRVSRVGDRAGKDSYVSPEIQRKALERWAADKGAGLILLDAEENVSGGTMDRPIFNRIMAGIRAGGYGGILVYRLDRFSRDLVGGLTVIRELAELGAFFASATEPQFDFSDAQSRMMFQFNLMLAEYFRETAKEGFRVALTNAVERGVHIAPGDAYGYDKDQSRPYTLDEARAPFVLEAFKRRAGGDTWESIADYLNSEAPPRLDGRPWVANTVYRMLKRRIYMGEARWGEVVKDDAHPAIVSEELWTEANRRVQTFSRERQGDEPLLNGIARCAGCSYTMSRALNQDAGRKRHYYRCRKVRVSGTCEAPASVAADFEGGLEEYVEDIVISELERSGSAFVAEEDDSALASALEALERAQERYQRALHDVDLEERIGREDFLARMDTFKARVEEAQADVDELRAGQAPMLAGTTAEEYQAMSREQRAKVLRALIDVVYVRRLPGARRGPRTEPLSPERVHILWRGQAPEYLPPKNAAGKITPWPWPSA